MSFLIDRFIKDILILAGDENEFAATFGFTVWLVRLPPFLDGLNSCDVLMIRRLTLFPSNETN
jgi:hypothetical protein